MFPFEPLFDKVLVEVTTAEEKTAGGIILPDQAKEEKFEGVVMAVGGGKWLESGMVRPLAVKIGDTVLFGRYSGDVVTIKNKPYRILREVEILGKFHNEPN